MHQHLNRTNHAVEQLIDYRYTVLHLILGGMQLMPYYFLTPLFNALNSICGVIPDCKIKSLFIISIFCLFFISLTRSVRMLSNFMFSVSLKFFLSIIGIMLPPLDVSQTHHNADLP